MNHDDHKPDLSTLIDPELEARIVAWVSGEASPFEAAELARLTNEKPELSIFKRRIEAVHGLVGEAIRPDQGPLRLSPERRTKLLQALGAAEFKPNSATAKNTVMLPLAVSKKKSRTDRRWLYGIAASLAIGLFTAVSIPSFQKMRYEEHSKSVVNQTSPEVCIPMEMPQVAWTPESAENDHRELTYKYAVSDAEKRKLEREEVNRLVSADRSTRQEEARNEAIAKAARDTKYDSDDWKKQAPRPAALAKAGLASPAPAATELHIGSYGAVRNPSPPLNNAPSLADGWAQQPAAGGKTIAGNEEQIMLSPFAAEAKGDTGYAASNILAGTRINAQPRDAGSPVTVVTKDFLKDIGATDNATPLQYAADTKVGGIRLRGLDGPAKEKPEAIVESDPAPAPRPVQRPAQTFSEINASKEPVSTFSLHVSDVSFRLAQAALAKGEELDRASIRPEEFYNAFSYGDPTPALSEKVSCRIEQAAHPFAQQRNLVRIAVKVAASGRDAAQPLHLTVLLDTSGSMEREDRAATIQSAMNALTSLLGPNDRLTLIGFSRQPRLLAEAVSGDQAAQVLDLIKSTPAEGGTNLEEALKLGSELAHRHFVATAQNRIVLLTDGAANLGNANPAQLAASIEALRQQGIAFDACGVGLEGLDDGMLENLTRKGDGRYYVLNSPEAADAGFAKQLAGAFRPAAENVKLQVRFNPARVGNYRLLGFEQHRLREEDFRNDKVDAAELAAEEAAVAVYQVEALPQGEGELGEVYVRFRDASSGNMVERNWTLNYDPQTPAFDRATPSIQLAGTAALLAEKLQGGEAAAAINLGDLAPIVTKLRSHYANEPRVQELVTMFAQARKMAGE